MAQRRAGADPGLLVMISLASGAKHGHAILLDITAFAGERLGPGTLYGAIERLERDRLIEPIGESDRRVPYRLTEAGMAYLRARLSTLRQLAVIGIERVGT